MNGESLQNLLCMESSFMYGFKTTFYNVPTVKKWMMKLFHELEVEKAGQSLNFLLSCLRSFSETRA